MRKRADGFHDISSLFCAISLFDEISLDFSDHNHWECNALSLKWDFNNLIFQAIALFCEELQEKLCFSISLKKNIPIGAGLGGGSGNAASILWGCNELTGRPFSIKELSVIGSKIGSDIAFFFSLGSAFCSGRGEVFKDVDLPKKSFWLAVPNFSLSTPDVYKHCQPEEMVQRDPEKTLKSFLEGKPHFYNDLEASALSLKKELTGVRNKLESMSFTSIVMTGSGSSYLCFGDIEPQSDKEIQFYRVQSIQRNPDQWYSKVL